MTNMAYSIGDRIDKVAPHHDSIQALWETKWKRPCSIGIYPFIDGKLEDFEPVFTKLVESNLRPPYDFDAYAAPFFPVASALEERAQAAEKSNDTPLASSLYLRAAAVYRIARFPIPRSPKQKEAWILNKAAYVKGAELLPGKFEEAQIPHTHRIEGEGDTIPIYMRLPADASATNPVPCIIQIFGLDGYRTEMTLESKKHLARGWGSIGVEIPGTGDCPALSNDPASPDRLWSSLLDWMDGREELDRERRVAWGLSTGGCYAMRIAHTHKERLTGVVSQGGGCHRMFDREWLDKVNHLEYPFDLAECLAEKFGYENVEELKKDGKSRFSLVESGILDKPCTRLLLANGTNDTIFPIEDSMIPLQHGSVKEARFIQNAVHMGEPAIGPVIVNWIEGLLGTKDSPKKTPKAQVQQEGNSTGSEGMRNNFLLTIKSWVFGH